MSTVDRALGLLALFSLARPEWSVEAAAQTAGLSQSTAYQYFRSLVKAGLIVATRPGRYVLGPGIIELDYLARHGDPLIADAQGPLQDLAAFSPDGALALLCRLYGARVMCVDQASGAAGFSVSYERGRPMPLTRGSASKVILAHMPTRAQKRAQAKATLEGATGDLGADWDTFNLALRAIRKAGVSVTHGELDPGLTGVSAPVFSPEGEVLASIGLVLADSAGLSLDDAVAVVRTAGRRLSLALKRRAEAA